MKRSVIFGALAILAALALIWTVLHPRTRITSSEPAPETNVSAAADAEGPPVISSPAPERAAVAQPRATEGVAAHPPAEAPPVVTNKLERLEQIRETFRSLAAGNPTFALRQAKELTDENERETALLTLVSEWTHGELGSPRDRARAIARLGLEAGLGIELAKNPELAILWANELTEGASRAAIVQRAASVLLDSNPAAAFALSEQLPQDARIKFYESLYEDWAEKDTAAAIHWAEQLPSTADRDGAMRVIRSVAPVGIGAVLNLQDGGVPVINGVSPGSPSALSGQIRPGDRIVAVAQGDNSWVTAQGLPLQKLVEMIRGTPGTVVQLQLQAADAAPNSPPRTVAIVRDQLKFKK